mmetsp:Transcript_20351/g.60494  ORF Transcript_20351/g.60494 Transcript_20351/m.60494 type:complete len:81 (+) Transcript_20351:3667-3909(+)
MTWARCHLVDYHASIILFHVVQAAAVHDIVLTDRTFASDCIASFDYSTVKHSCYAVVYKNMRPKSVIGNIAGVGALCVPT